MQNKQKERPDLFVLLRSVIKGFRGSPLNFKKKQWVKIIRSLMIFTLAKYCRIIVSGRMRWTGHLAHSGKKRNPYKVLVLERDHLENLDVNG